MDLAATLKSEIVRPTLTLVVPGLTAIAPFLIQSKRLLPNLSRYLERHSTLASFTILLAVLAVGLILQSIGSWFEAGIIDRKLEARYPNLSSDRYDYLRLSYTTEPIGQRYLRTVTLHLKFELSMAPAVMLTLIGVNWINSDLHVFGTTQIWSISIALGLIAAYSSVDTQIRPPVDT